jgi:predicted Ser/Thr protein kinase
VLAFAEGRVVGAALACVEEHLHVCGDCRSVVAETAKFFQSDTSSEQPASLDGPLLAPGTQVSRYVVTNVLGSGAAGVVYRAHDPQLRRKIALKLLRPEHSHRPEGATLETRLLREARAMAQLSHPNVVTVFDVGRFDGQIFLVMELVEGETLASWLTREQPWRERMRLFVEAARGLSAAHAVQIAHRDFKPANVLVGADGRVRVTDFGLARPWNLEPSTLLDPSLREPTLPASARRALLSGVTATEAGGVAGTPAFMAPEQFLRRETDARTDQFSFCVALYQALYRASPFRGRSFEELQDAVVNGRLEAPPSDKSDIPMQLYAVLRRGLSVDPAARFGDMHALVSQLLVAADDTSPRTRRRVLALALAASALLAAGVTAQQMGRAPATAELLTPPMRARAANDDAAAAQKLAASHTSAAPLASKARSEPAHTRVAGETRTGADKARKRMRRQVRKASTATPAPTRVRYDDQLKDPF